MNAPPLSSAQLRAWRLAAAAWLALLLLTVLWEWLLAPLRPGGSWLVLKGAPMLLPLAGVLRGDVQPMQWATLLALLYIAEGSVRVAEAWPVRALAIAEMALGLAFFVAVRLLEYVAVPWQRRRTAR